MKNNFITDKYDKRILYELDRNSKMRISDLASKIKRSKQFVLYRLRRFEEEGIITHYTAIVDMSKIGFFTFRIYVKFRKMTRKEIAGAISYLKKLENIWTIATCHGKWDIAFFIGTKNVKRLHEIWDDFLSLYKGNIERYNFSLYSPVYNFNRTFFLDEEAQVETRIYGEFGSEKIDDADFRIIKVYAPDVRRPLNEIGKKVGLSPEAVRYRIKSLEKRKIICGYKIGINAEKMGFTSYRIDIRLLSTKRNAEIFSFCKRCSSIYQINKTIGGSDFEIEAIVRDLGELLNLIDRIKETFSDVVENVDYFSYSAYYLLNYIPD